MIKSNIMEKLELKHIVGYLPYGLEVIIDLGNSSSIANISKNGFDRHFLYSLSENKVKIIGLRPLSDLTKDIEVNGEKFVPIAKIEFTHSSSKYQFIDNAFYCNNYGKFLEITEMPYTIIQKLYEWHFDIHGLIEKGLAIDINTLSND